jgi:plastocyanin
MTPYALRLFSQPAGSLMRTRFLLVGVVVVLMTACSSPRIATDTLTVVGGADFTFTPRVVTVPKATPITLTFTANGVDHTYVVKDAIQDGEIDVSDGLLTRRATGPNDIIVAEAAAGQTVTVTFTMPERGVYLVYCMLPEHRENGMFGTLVVE